MTRQTVAQDLAELIEKLQAERREHMDAVKRIDAVFERYGITPQEEDGNGRGGRRRRFGVLAEMPAPFRRKRRFFGITGNELILAFVKDQGSPSTAEINQHWKEQGRGGKADNLLVQLVKQGKLTRKKIKGDRGSQYSVV